MLPILVYGYVMKRLALIALFGTLALSGCSTDEVSNKAKEARQTAQEAQDGYNKYKDAASEGWAQGEGLSKSGSGTAKTSGCKRPSKVVDISFSKTKYPNIFAHTERAIQKGEPKVLILNRRGAEERRKQLLAGIPTKPGFDRDEYAPAVGRDTWKADVEYVPSSENRSHGSSMGIKLRQYCDGTRFRYLFY